MKKILVLFIFLFLIGWGAQCDAQIFGFFKKTAVYGVFGDSIAEGGGSMPLSKSFAALTTAALNEANPELNVVMFKHGLTNVHTWNYSVSAMPDALSKITKLDKGQLRWAVIMIGLADLLSIPPKTPWPQCVKAAKAYKVDLQRCIDQVMKYNPDCKLVLCTLPDPNNGGKGTFPPYIAHGLLEAFNKQILELGVSDKIPVADAYKALMGHKDWYIEGDAHPNNAGHAAIAALIEEKWGIEPNPTPTPTP